MNPFLCLRSTRGAISVQRLRKQTGTEKSQEQSFDKAYQLLSSDDRAQMIRFHFQTKLNGCPRTDYS